MSMLLTFTDDYPDHPDVIVDLDHICAIVDGPGLTRLYTTSNSVDIYEAFEDAQGMLARAWSHQETQLMLGGFPAPAVARAGLQPDPEAFTPLTMPWLLLDVGNQAKWLNLRSFQFLEAHGEYGTVCAGSFFEHMPLEPMDFHARFRAQLERYQKAAGAFRERAVRRMMMASPAAGAS